jgi:hypothetical protein
MLKVTPTTFYCLIILSAACKKHTCHSTGPDNEKTVNVYVLGTVGDSVISWKNGTPHSVYDQSRVNNYFGSPSIVASGNNVFIPGIKLNNNTSVPAVTPLYWQNDAAVVLPDSAGNATATCIYVSNNDVYVAGVTDYYKDTSHVPYTTPSAIYPKKGTVATVWKNGVDITLPGFFAVGLVNAGQYAVRGYNDYVSSIFVSGNDVYVAGGSRYVGNNAMYWKNGIPVNISDKLTYTALGKTCFPTTTSIAVSGNDVYIAGYQTTSTGQVAAIYWKNGTPVFLTDSLHGAAANSIFVSGNDVYIAGYQNINNYWRATIWKNGVPTTLTTGPVASAATSVFVEGNDVYVAGDEWKINGYYIATYWKNGEEVKLTDGTIPAIANSIYVQ